MSNPPLVLIDLIERLRTEGLTIGLEEHVHAQRLCGAEGAWDLPRLRLALQALLVSNLEDKSIFDRVFDDWTVRYIAGSELGPARGSDLRRPRPVWLYWLVGAVAIAVIFGWIAWQRSAPDVSGPATTRSDEVATEKATHEVEADQEPTKPDKEQVPEVAEAAARAGVPDTDGTQDAAEKEDWEIADGAEKAAPPALDAEQPMVAHAEQPMVAHPSEPAQATSVLVSSALLATAGVVLLVLLALVWRRQKPVAKGRGPFTFRTNFKSTKTAGLDDDQYIEDVASSLMFRGTGLSMRLDVDGSIHRTIAHGGLPSLVYEQPPSNPNYAVLLDAESGPVSTWLEGLFQRVRRAGVKVDIFTTYGSPMVGLNPDGVAIDLESLATRRCDALIVVGTTDGAVDPMTGEAAAWVASLKRFPERVWLETRPLGSWGLGARLVDRDGDTRVLPPSLSVLRLARPGEDQIRKEDLGAPWPRVVDRQPGTPRAVDELRSWLGDAWPAACATALLPRPEPSAVAWLLEQCFGGLEADDVLRLLSLPHLQRANWGEPLETTLATTLREEHPELATEVYQALELGLREQEPPVDSVAHSRWAITLGETAVHHDPVLAAEMADVAAHSQTGRVLLANSPIGGGSEASPAPPCPATWLADGQVLSRVVMALAVLFWIVYPATNFHAISAIDATLFFTLTIVATVVLESLGWLWTGVKGDGRWHHSGAAFTLMVPSIVMAFIAVMRYLPDATLIAERVVGAIVWSDVPLTPTASAFIGPPLAAVVLWFLGPYRKDPWALVRRPERQSVPVRLNKKRTAVALVGSLALFSMAGRLALAPQPEHTVDLRHSWTASWATGSPVDVGITAGAERVFVTFQDGTVQILDGISGEGIGAVILDDGAPKRLAVDRAGRHFLALSEFGSIVLVDVSKLTTRKLWAKNAADLALTADGNTLFVAHDRGISTLDVASGLVLGTTVPEGSPPIQILASHGGGSVAFLQDDGKLELQSIWEGEQLRVLSSPAEIRRIVDLSDQRALIAESAQGTLLVWDLRDNPSEGDFHSRELPLEDDGPRVLTTFIDPDGRVLGLDSLGRFHSDLSVAGSETDTEGRTSVTSGANAALDTMLGPVHAAVVADDGRTWAIATTGDAVSVWSSLTTTERVLLADAQREASEAIPSPEFIEVILFVPAERISDDVSDFSQTQVAIDMLAAAGFEVISSHAYSRNAWTGHLQEALGAGQIQHDAQLATQAGLLRETLTQRYPDISLVPFTPDITRIGQPGQFEVLLPDERRMTVALVADLDFVFVAPTDVPKQELGLKKERLKNDIQACADYGMDQKYLREVVLPEGRWVLSVDRGRFTVLTDTIGDDSFSSCVKYRIQPHLRRGSLGQAAFELRFSIEHAPWAQTRAE